MTEDAKLETAEQDCDCDECKRYRYGVAQGRKHERTRIVAWLWKKALVMGQDVGTAEGRMLAFTAAALEAGSIDIEEAAAGDG